MHKKRIFIYSIPFIFIISAYTLRFFYMKYIASLNIPCFVHLITGYWCPGCGGTRSMNELSKGHIIKSLHYNPISVVLLINFILIYIQLIFNTHNIKKRVLPENDMYIVILVIAMLFYYLIRNFIPFLQPL